MSTIVLEAQARSDVGRGASRRLRRLENKIPAIVYGGKKEPKNILFPHNKITKALENEAIFSSVITVNIDGKKESVILKDMQRHPYKPIILHMDFQRVSNKDVLVRQVPLHFVNEQDSLGVKAGGVISHALTQVEIRCQAQHLPEYIVVDMTHVELNHVIHLADLILPENTQLTADVTDAHHNLPVVSVHLPKIIEEPEEVVEEGADVEATEQNGADGGTESNETTDSEAPHKETKEGESD